jgi:hypothetical protein
MSTPENRNAPVPGYDDLPVDLIGQHVRSLNVLELGRLLDYERAHANRPEVTRVVDTRLAELRTGAEGGGATQDSAAGYTNAPGTETG